MAGSSEGTNQIRPGLFSVIAVLTAVALVVALRVRVGSLEWRAEYPAMSLKEPTRALFVFVERERRLAQARPWRLLPEPNCRACTASAAAARFHELVVEQQRYLAAGYRKHRGAGAARETSAARVIALAGWGKPDQLAELRALSIDGLPDYLSDRAIEILRGDSAPEDARIASLRVVRNALNLLEWGICLLAIGACIAWYRGYRYPRRGRRTRLSSPTLGRGLLVFIWAQAFVAACARLRLEYPDTAFGLLAAMPGLALVIGVLALLKVAGNGDEGPAELLRCPPDGRSRRALGLVTVTLVGIVFGFRILAGAAAAKLGVLDSWTQGFNERLCFGTPIEAALRAFSSIVLAPFGEEMAYRGVLFGALATRLRTHRAALASALLFAAMHGYGVIGFSSVALSGYLRARVSARTGTLLPAILSHTLNNAVAIAWELTLRG